VNVDKLTAHWGRPSDVRLYLSRCQVDTPRELVDRLWSLVRRRRAEPFGSVVDFGAGDCRFAFGVRYDSYVGYEVDRGRCARVSLPNRASIKHACAFSSEHDSYAIAVGNPPFVRNQDLPDGWRSRASSVIQQRTGVSLSGLANAWQYFSLLSLSSTHAQGLVALILPFEWVSRPSSEPMRDFIRRHRWAVDVYRLNDVVFSDVHTTSCITLVDKSVRTGQWRYFSERPDGSFEPLRSATGVRRGPLPFSTPASKTVERVFAKRGLSPGTQKVMTLTEAERARHGLSRGRDVVPCVTTFRDLDPSLSCLTPEAFDAHFVRAGRRCWLLRVDRPLSPKLKGFLDSVPVEQRRTATCLGRAVWWRFGMPEVPEVLVATGFRGPRPKAMINSVGARSIGGVAGIYGIESPAVAERLVRALRRIRIDNRLVAHARGLRKIEISQLQALVRSILEP